MDEKTDKTGETSGADAAADEASKVAETPDEKASAEETTEKAAGEEASGEKKAAEAEEEKQAEKPAGPTPLERARAETRAAQERYLRTMADFDNFRKRTARDREDLFKQAAADVLKDVLGTVDDLSLALGKAEKADDPFVAGVRMVYDNLMKTLAKHGATPVDSLGEPFDANFHEALAQLPDAKVPEGHVVNEVKRGWLLNGKLLRVAQVVVSSGKPA